MNRVDALIMAGGRGKRLGLGEKPLVEIDGIPLIDIVLAALSGSKYVEDVVVATSKHTKATYEFLKAKSVKTLFTRGDDYVEDLIFAVKKLELGKTLVVSCDLPFISSEDIDAIIEEYYRQKCPAMKIMVPLEVFNKYNLEPSIISEGLVPSGINLIDGNNLDGKEYTYITEKEEFGFNLNTLKDLKMIERYKKLINK